MSAALRYFSGVLSIAAGRLWMVPLFLAGGHLLDAASVQPGDALGVVASLLLFAVAAGFVCLFSFGAMSMYMRDGPSRPRLWIACLTAGLITSIAAGLVVAA